MINQQPAKSATTETLLFDLREQREALLNLILWIAAVMTSALVVGSFVAVALGREPLALRQFALLPIVLWLAILLRRQIPFWIRAGLLLIPALIGNVYDLTSIGLVGSGSMSLLVLAIVWALLFGIRQGFVMVLVTTVLTAVVGQQIFLGSLTPDRIIQETYISGEAWLGFTLSFGLQLALLAYLFFRLVESSQETLLRQQALRQTIVAERNTLEERVIERTRALRLTAEASRSMSNILERNQLLLEVVDQIQKAFNYYHVHVYQLDDDQRFLHIAGGTGEAGKALLIGKHKLGMGQGLVGRAAQTQKPIFVPDVRQEQGWMPNPLLPETKAEIAVPIVLGQQLVGVLDVQHNITNGLTTEDVGILESLANQMAVALRNATIYEQAQNHASQAALINIIGQKIQFAPDVNFTLQTAVREVAEALNANRASITLDVQRFFRPTPTPEEQA